MDARIYRRCLAFLVVAALSLGLVAQGFAAGVMEAQMTTAMAGGEMSSMGCCDGHPDSSDTAMPAGACSAICSGSTPVLEDGLALEAIALDNAVASAALSRDGHDSPPDTYPPRSAVLS